MLYFINSRKWERKTFPKKKKIAILGELFKSKPQLFLERYHNLITQEFLCLFDGEEGSYTRFLLDNIRQNSLLSGANRSNTTTRNRRYLAMLNLRNEGSYFSNEKMREREPQLFHKMVGKYYDDERPTLKVSSSPSIPRQNGYNVVEVNNDDENRRVSDTREFYLNDQQQTTDEPASQLYPPTSSDQIDRFLCHVNNRIIEAENTGGECGGDVEMDSSSSSEGDEVAGNEWGEFGHEIRKIYKRDLATAVTTKQIRRAKLLVGQKFSRMRISRDEKLHQQNGHHIDDNDTGNNRVGGCQEYDDELPSSDDENEHETFSVKRDRKLAEFVALMEQRFINGLDGEFFDYSTVDSGSHNNDRIMNQDIEDSYFDEEEPN